MEVDFSEDNLDRLETDSQFNSGLSQETVRAYRMRMQQIRGAFDECDFKFLKSLGFKKLNGDRDGQHSIRLNLQWKLILEIRVKQRCKVVAIIEIADHH